MRQYAYIDCYFKCYIIFYVLIPSDVLVYISTQESLKCNRRRKLDTFVVDSFCAMLLDVIGNATYVDLNKRIQHAGLFMIHRLWQLITTDHLDKINSNR